MKKLTTLIGALALALSASFVSAAPPPTCEVLCVSSPCSSNRDCPGGRCNLVCPKNGCCEYSS